MHNKNQTEKEVFTLALHNHQKNNLKVAEKLYKKIINTNPSHFDSIFLLGTLLAQKKKFEASEKFLIKAIKIQPNNVNAYHNLGIISTGLERFEKGIFYSQKAIQMQPDHVEAMNNLGNIYNELREFEKAKNYLERAIQINPRHAKSYNNLGNVLKELGSFQEAIEAYKKTIQIQPNNSKAYYNLGLLFKILGNFNEAENAYHNVIMLDPNNLIALHDLSNLNKKILNSNIKNRIKKIIKDSFTSKKNKAYGNFLLSKYELKNKNYKKEFVFLLKGHLYYFKSEQNKFEKGINYWINKLPKKKELNDFNNSITNFNKIKPIFIIGVPRCGSTLIEKVIASGPQYIPMGEETGILSSLIGKKINKKESIVQEKANLRINIIKKYEEKGLIQEKSNYSFTDKSLDNFFYIALIKEIFPQAKIINCKRNLLSSIMSILKTNLRDVSWAHNLDHIFKFFDIYLKKIEYFKKKFPNFIYDLQFETFVDNPKTESKKLMDFCNLPWNLKCLEFYKRKDFISQTASNIQIRKSIYKDEIQKYLPYKKFLKKYKKKYKWFK